jgi:hypothetical protein
MAAGATAGGITGGAVYTVRSVASHLHRQKRSAGSALGNIR